MTSDSGKITTYADAGVNIDAGNALVSRIAPLVHATSRAGVAGGFGGFGGMFDLQEAGYGDTMLVAATDGVGTKLHIAQHARKHDTIGIDLVAMCVNDLLAQAAEPLFFLDYYACGRLSPDMAAQVVEGIAEGCKIAGCALIGGETAEMPGMYQGDSYDLAGFSVGAVRRGDVLPKKHTMQAGDVLIGLASDGIHSNGFSLVRALLTQSQLAYDAPAPWASQPISVAESLLTPTRIYVRSCLPCMRDHDGVSGFAHITGGGLTENIPRVLPAHLSASIGLGNWELPPVFAWLQEAGGLAEAEMLKTFNCGIGAVLIAARTHADALLEELTSHGECACIIGELYEFDDHAVTYTGTL
ncbi:MAG: phosphoribosylformylglycinamidine cyclo-ligase [Sphaerospermopsis sp. SIO1G2]|nr:phosphoribosylformylglycinamidine cyclo-ligase [Sphaerospermopsis sp. SIO1G2]